MDTEVELQSAGGMPQGSDDDVIAGLTEPQARAVRHTEGPLLVLAGPGSGKTRVITRRIAHLVRCGIPPWQILALTFTNKAAAEMRERVLHLLGEGAAARGLTVTTFHALCARLLRRWADVANLPGLKPDFAIFDSADQLALMKKTIEGLNLSTSNWPPRSVLSRISEAKNDLQDAETFAANQHDFAGRTAAKIYLAYQKALRTAGGVDFDDLLVLTARMLRENATVREACRERWQYLLIDEYQDTNRAQFVIASLLAGEGREGRRPNICVVGDPDQCLPAGTPILTEEGARPVESVRDGDRVVAATGWGRTRAMSVDKAMSRPYHGPMVVLTLESGEELRATPNHIGFARLRPDSGYFYTYLMWKRGVGYRIGITSGVRTSKDGELISGLQVRTNQEVADAVWVLHASRSSAETRFYEHLYSVRYGIPSMVFFVRGRRMDITQDYIDRLYKEIDSAENAERLMNDLHLDPRYPHHRPGAVTRTSGPSGPWARRHVICTIFGDGRLYPSQTCHAHRVQLVTSDLGLRAAAEGRFPVRNGVRGTWRVETSRKDYDVAMQLAREIASLADDMEIVPRARLTPDKAFAFMPVGQIKPGMAVPLVRGGEAVEGVVASARIEEYDGPVYDVSVPGARNYVAGGIVVHNSIYGWRGADITNILDFEKAFPGAEIIALGENFRSTQKIINAADAMIRRNTRRKHKTLFTSNPPGERIDAVSCRDEHHEAQVVLEWFRARRAEGLAWKDMAVFYRTNALSRVVEDELRNAGVPYVVARGTAYFQREEIKNAVAYLRVVANPADDVSLDRVINTPARGIGDTSLDKLRNVAAIRGVPLADVLRSLESGGAGALGVELTARAQNAITKFMRTLDDWRDFAKPSPFMGAAAQGEYETGALAELVERVIRESGLEAMYKAGRTDTDEERLANLAELVTSAREFEETFDPGADPVLTDPRAAAAGEQRTPPNVLTMLHAYLERVTLVADADSVDPAQGAVTLMTLHAAKGLEFGAVAMVGLEERILPHSRVAENPEELEEERRLCFVGITRAMKRLLLTDARYRSFRGVPERQIPSRFLTELPADLVSHSDQSEEFGGEDPGRGGAWDKPSATLESIRGAQRPAQARVGGRALAEGALVRHPQFGLGRVESVTGGQGARARIRFRDVGVKTLVLEYARLELVDEG